MYFHLDAKEGGPQYPPAIFYAHDRRKASEDSGVKTHSLTHSLTLRHTRTRRRGSKLFGRGSIANRSGGTRGIPNGASSSSAEDVQNVGGPAARVGSFVCKPSPYPTTTTIITTTTLS